MNEGTALSRGHEVEATLRRRKAHPANQQRRACAMWRGQTRVTVIMISLVNNQPKTLSLKAMLQHFIDFRVQVIERRTQFFLAKAQARDHIVQGLLLAMDNLDKLVDIIRKAADNQTAAAALTAAYGLTPTQTDAVLSISLRRLTSAEVQKLKAEHLELEATINDLVRSFPSGGAY
jgi:DNA gyrase subunit A